MEVGIRPISSSRQLKADKKLGLDTFNDTRSRVEGLKLIRLRTVALIEFLSCGKAPTYQQYSKRSIFIPLSIVVQQ